MKRKSDQNGKWASQPLLEIRLVIKEGLFDTRASLPGPDFARSAKQPNLSALLWQGCSGAAGLLHLVRSERLDTACKLGHCPTMNLLRKILASLG